MRTQFYLIGLLFVLASCSTNPTVENNPENGPAIVSLQALIKKIPLLPNDTYTLTFEFPQSEKLYEVDGGTSDSLFFYPMTSIYGLLPDTNKFYSFLSYAPVENGALTLTIIDKAAKVIDSKQLSTELYGCGCGYQWFGQVFVRKHNEFLMRDSIVTFNCDSIGPLPEEYWKHEIITRTAKTLADGRIALSELQRTTVKE